MKIRTDFVTNSSSSSFCTVKISGDNVSLKMDLAFIGFYTFWFRDPEAELSLCKSTNDLLEAIMYALSANETDLRVEYIKKELEQIPDISSLRSIRFDCHEEIEDRSWGDPWPRNVTYDYNFKTGLKSYSTDISWRKYRGQGDALAPEVRDSKNCKLPFLVDKIKGRLCIVECSTADKVLVIPERVVINNEELTIQGLGEKCFLKAGQLEEIVLPKSVEYIAPNAFYGCKKNLKTLCFEGQEKTDPMLVEACQKLDLVLYSGKEFAIPDEITELGDFVFGGCWNLETIVLHDGMKKPTAKALSSSTSLKQVKLSDGTKVSITEDAAKKCFTAKKGVIGFNYEKYAALMVEAGNADELEKAVKAGNLSAAAIKELYESVKLKRKPEYKRIKEFLSSHGGTDKLSSADQKEFDEKKEKKKLKTPSISQLRRDKRYKDWIFTLMPDHKSLRIDGYKGDEAEVAIPEEIGGMPVVELGYDILKLSQGVNKLFIPHTVSSLRADSFSSCQSLEYLYVDPANPQYSSANGALYNKDATELLVVPRSVRELKIPASAKRIDRLALSSIVRASIVEVEAGNTTFFALDNVLYDRRKKQLIYASKYAENVIVPDGITSIARDVFSTRINLKSVDLPNSITTIGGNAFAWCSSLEEVSVSPNVKVLSKGVFHDCTNLRKVTLHEGLERIEQGAFENCEALEELRVPASVKLIQNDAFKNCRSLRVILQGNSTTMEEFALGNSASAASRVFSEKEYESLTKAERTARSWSIEDSIFLDL